MKSVSAHPDGSVVRGLPLHGNQRSQGHAGVADRSLVLLEALFSFCLSCFASLQIFRDFMRAGLSTCKTVLSTQHDIPALQENTDLF